MDVPPDTLSQLLNHTRQLYSLPAVALEVLELANQPQIDTTRLKECIEHDPALTTKVLRIVNSSLFGLSRRVSDLNQALAVLGIKPLKMLVLAFSLPEPLFASLARDVLNQYWKHTLTRAVAARELAERVWCIPGDELFVAGLLKDLGRLVLIQGLGRPYVEMLRKADWPREDVRALERRLIGFDHVGLTAGLLGQWSLPDTIIRAVESPERGDEFDNLSDDARTEATILYLAEKLAELLADERTEALGELLKVIGHGGRLSEKQLAAITASLDETVTQLADVLSLDLPQGLAYGEVLARAYAQLSLVASDAAGDLIQSAEVASRLREFADREEARNLSAALAQLQSCGADIPPAGLGSAGVALAPREPVTSTATETATKARRPSGSIAVARRPAKNAATSRSQAPTAVMHPGMRAKIVSAAALCRQMRQELSLLIVEIDNFEELVFTRGLMGVEPIRQHFFDACRLAVPEQPPSELTDCRFAVVLPGYDRPRAADAAHLLLRVVREEVVGEAAATLSIGASTVAVPAKNFDPVEIVRSAERCLRAAQLSGGNGFKSIEAY